MENNYKGEKDVETTPSLASFPVKYVIYNKTGELRSYYNTTNINTIISKILTFINQTIIYKINNSYCLSNGSLHISELYDNTIQIQCFIYNTKYMNLNSIISILNIIYTNESIINKMNITINHNEIVCRPVISNVPIMNSAITISEFGYERKLALFIEQQYDIPDNKTILSNDVLLSSIKVYLKRNNLEYISSYFCNYYEIIYNAVCQRVVINQEYEDLTFLVNIFNGKIIAIII